MLKENEYKRVEIESATPAQRIAMLYEAAIKFLRLAKEGFENGDIAQRGENIGKAISVIGYLRSILDMERGQEIARALDKLYEYMIHELGESNLRKDPKRLETVLNLVTQLREAWQIIEKNESGSN